MEAIAQRKSAPDALNGVDISKLAQSHWGLRFTSPETEAQFRLWQRHARIPYLKFAFVSGFFFSCFGLLEVRFGERAQFAAIATECASYMWPLFAASLLLLSRPRLERWALPTAMASHIASGLLILHWYYQTIFVPDVAYGWVCIIAFFPFLIFRFSPAQAVLGALPYYAFHQWLLDAAVSDGRVTAAAAVWYSTNVWAVFSVGLLLNLLDNRNTRTAYRQERIIELQQLALERERARTAQLQEKASAQEMLVLNQEVRRQVAERSRDLAEALLRSVDKPQRPLQIAPGDLIDERYRIIRLLGEGGMGQVHEVERLSDQHRFALKVLTRAARRDSLVRFAREAQIAAQLDHPNVVPALDIGVTPDGTPFLVMPLVAGTTLAKARDRYGDAQWAGSVLLQIARALAAMHGQGIIHRDLKPSNVLLDGAIVKVSDFGISSFAEPLETQSLTGTGAIIGTPHYLAPELVGGESQADAAIDMFSFGVVAYELFTSRLPHASPPVLDRLERRPLTPATPLLASCPKLSKDLASLVDQCLSQMPAARPTALAAVEVLAGERAHALFESSK